MHINIYVKYVCIYSIYALLTFLGMGNNLLSDETSINGFWGTTSVGGQILGEKCPEQTYT